MQYAVLSSGSKGNATVIKGEHCNILIDCGISKKKLTERLLMCGLTINDIDFVLVTHKHTDHISGVGIFDKSKLCSQLFVVDGLYEDHVLSPFTKYSFNGIIVTPLPLYHDAPNTTGFLIEENGERLTYITDTGFISEDVISLTANSDYFILESNHDPKMLCESNRPPELIKRILGDFGHLSNSQASYYLTSLIGPKTKEVIFAHLSEECNTKDKTMETYEKVMKSQFGEVPSVLVRCADQENVYMGGHEKAIA